MANISAGMVKELRDQTGAGMMDCKAALSESDGNLEAAVDWLRKKGLSKAAKKAGRVAAEGLIGIATTATKGLMVEVNSEHPAYFGGYVNENYCASAQALRLARDEIAAIVRNGIKASLMTTPEKDKALADVDRVLAENV